MTSLDTVIGVFGNFESDDIVSVADFKKKSNFMCPYTPQQYCDFRYSTNLQRFIYDPYTGEKIDWKEVKRMLEE